MQGVAGALSVHVAMREAVQLGVNQRRQTIKRRSVPIAPILEHLSYLRLSSLIHWKRNVLIQVQEGVISWRRKKASLINSCIASANFHPVLAFYG